MLRETKEGLLAVALIAVAALLPAAPALAKPKPDLKVVRAQIVGKPYALSGERAAIRVSDVTENAGRAEAPATVNRLTLHHSGADRLDGVTRKVPKLGAGKHSAGVGKAEIDVPAGAELGAYNARLCADARSEVSESGGANNCDELGKFYIVKKDWSGSFGGSTTPYELDGVTETWHTSDARFELDPGSPLWAPDQGFFIYKLAQATVSYNDSGSAQGCTWSGSGIDHSQIGELRLSYTRDWYIGQGQSGADFTYPVTPVCPPPGGTGYDGPAPEGLTPFYTGGTDDLPFGTTRLAGNAGAGPPDYDWSLK